MGTIRFHNGTLILADGLLANGTLDIDDGRISAVTPHADTSRTTPAQQIDLQGGYLAPGFVDLHVHGGAGADFMDGTADAFRMVCAAHLRHGTTSLLPTTTVARHDPAIGRNRRADP